MGAEILCGIYKITNTINGNCYIGQSVNISKRWQAYNCKSKDRTPIIHAVKKYGVEAFEFEIVERCSRELLNEREIFWISELKCLAPSGYNLSTGGRKTTWAYKPTAETLRKRSIALTGKKRSEETKLKISLAQKGKIQPPGHMEMLRLLSIGRPSWNKGVPMTDEAKEKVRSSKVGTKSYWSWKPVIRNDGQEFASIEGAARAIGAHRNTIFKHLAGKLKTVHGYTFVRGVPPSQA
jgi:group I intron endonuclease